MKALLLGLSLAAGLHAGPPAQPYPQELAQASEAPYRYKLLEHPVWALDGPRVVGLRLQAWQDPACASNDFSAVYLDKAGKPLGEEHGLAKAAPFAGGPELYAFAQAPSGTATAAFYLDGRGPCAGTWWAEFQSIGKVQSPLPPGIASFHVADDGLSVFALADGSGWDLKGKERALARLRLGNGWSLQRLSVPMPLSAPTADFLVQGPRGQRGQVILGGDPHTDLRGLAIQVRLQGLKPGDFSLSLEPADGDWLLPFNQGLRVPLAEAEGLSTGWDMDLRAGHFVSMPALGWARGEESLLLWCQDPADAAFRFWPKERSAGLVWRPSQGAWQGAWHLRLGYQPNGGPLAWAARLRGFQQLAWAAAGAKAPSTALDDRLSPDQAHRLAGAVNIHYWKKALWWTNEPKPAAMLQGLKAAGIDRVLWSQKVDAAMLGPMAAQGWLTGSYENFQDVYPSDTPLAWTNKEGWPEQAVLRANGDWVRGWPAKDHGKTYYAGVRSSRAAVGYVRAALDERRRRGQSAVFLDTTTATGPVEDWTLQHPMTRSQDIAYKMDQLGYGSRQGLVVGSESGHDGALGVAHYFEGMQSPWAGRFDDAGYELASIRPASEPMQKWNLSPRYRAPLFDLAWHDSYVGYEYWGDAANRLPEHWRRKDLYSVLYAQPQLWVMDEERWTEQKERARKSYATWSPVVRHLFGQRMTDWKALDANGDVQETRWEDGSVVRVDFLNERIELKGPVMTKVFGAQAK